MPHRALFDGRSTPPGPRPPHGRSVESSRCPSPSCRVHRVQQRGFQHPLASRAPGPVYSDTRPGGLRSDHSGSATALNQRGHSGPPRPSTAVTPPRTLRSIAATSFASGTQPTVSVCWATQLFIRSWHVACVAQSRITLPAARYELLEHRRQQSRPFLRVLAQPALAVALP